MKRIVVSVLLIAVLSVAAFANGQQDTAATGERPTLTVWTHNPPPEVPLEETQIWPLYEQLFSAKIEFEYTVGDAMQRAGTILASGDFPDTIAVGSQEMEMFVEAGQFVDMSDYIRNSEELPGSYPADYIEAHFAREDGVVPYLSNGVPMEATPGPPGGGWWMQLRVLRWAGWPEHFTFDEYIDTLRGFAEEFPETNGQPTISYIFQNANWQLDTLTNPPAELQGKVDGGGFWFDEVNGQWVPQIVTGTPEQQRFLQALNELYVEGLLDEESFVHSQDQYQAKMAEGRFLGGYGYAYQLNAPREALRDQDLLDHSWVPVPVTFEEGQVPPHRVRSGGQGIIGGFAIMPDAPDPDLAWQVLVEEWLSDEAVTMRHWGIEGVHYEVGEDGVYTMTDEQIQNWHGLSGAERDRDRMRMTGARFLPYHSSLLLLDNGNVRHPDNDPEIFGAEFTDDPLWAEYIEAYGVDAPGQIYEVKAFPSHGWTWNISREDEVGVAYENWDEFRRRWYPRLILAEEGEFDSVWEDYQAAIEDDIRDDIDLWMERAEFVGNFRAETNNPNANP
jgi:putative aldouronate transport system substrate-binding protein